MAIYNGEQYVVESIKSVLQQDVASLELIIVDDGSTDNSVAVMQSYIKTYVDSNRFPYKIYLYARNHRGFAASQNDALRSAQGDYLAFIDADDLWEEGKLSKQLAVMNETPDLDMVFGYTQQFRSPELSEEESKKIYCPSDKQPAVTAVSMLIRHPSFKKVGNFNEKWEKGPFIDWYARAEEMGLTHVMLADILFRRRLHKNNMGRHRRHRSIDYVRIIKEALDRRRQHQITR